MAAVQDNIFDSSLFPGIPSPPPILSVNYSTIHAVPSKPTLLEIIQIPLFSQGASIESASSLGSRNTVSPGFICLSICTVTACPRAIVSFPGDLVCLLTPLFSYNIFPQSSENSLMCLWNSDVLRSNKQTKILRSGPGLALPTSLISTDRACSSLGCHMAVFFLSLMV